MRAFAIYFFAVFLFMIGESILYKSIGLSLSQSMLGCLMGMCGYLLGIFIVIIEKINQR
jgi:hypothetical protein